jgi:hypothetical protein
MNEDHHSELYGKQVAVVFVNRDFVSPMGQVVSAAAGSCCKTHLQANWTEHSERLQPRCFWRHIHLPSVPLIILSSFLFCLLPHFVDLCSCFLHTDKRVPEETTQLEKTKSRCESNNKTDSGLLGFINFVHVAVFWRTLCFGNWIYCRLQVREWMALCPVIEVSPF